MTFYILITLFFASIIANHFCFSQSSGSWSESGTQTQKSVKSKGGVKSDNNISSDDEDDSDSTGLKIVDGSDGDSNTQVIRVIYLSYK